MEKHTYHHSLRRTIAIIAFNITKIELYVLFWPRLLEPSKCVGIALTVDDGIDKLKY